MDSSMEEQDTPIDGTMALNGSDGSESPIYDISWFYDLYQKDDDLSIEQKVTKACNLIELDETSLFPKSFYENLKSIALSLGVPFEYVAQPLLSIASNLMNGSKVVVKEPQFDTDKGHIEPTIINTLTLGAKSTNKSAAFKLFEEILKIIEKEEIADKKEKFELEAALSSADDVNDGPSSSKRAKSEFNPNLYRRFSKKTSEPGLTAILTREDANKNIVLLYEEFYVFSSLLDFANPKSSFLPTYLEAYGGSLIRQLTQPRGVEEAENPTIQFLVYAQPSVFIKESSRCPDDPSGAWERMLIVNPKRRIVDLEECHQTPLSTKCDISTVLRLIRDAHEEQGVRYKFEESAKTFFYEVDRDMKAQMREREDDTDFCGILGKDVAKIIRISSVFCELRNVSKSIDPGFIAVGEVIENCISQAVSKSTKDVVVDDNMLQFLNEEIVEAVMIEDYERAQQLKLERDQVAKGIQPSWLAEDGEIGEDRFLIKLEDVKSAMTYVKHCTGIAIQLKAGAREFAETQRGGMGSPLKASKTKGRNKSYWAEDLDDVDKPFDFVMSHSDKIVKMWEHAENGQISMKTAKSKHCFPLPSSARPRGAQVEKALCVYFTKILVRHGLLDRLSDDETFAVLPQADEISEEVERKFSALRKKHHDFKPFE